jgi:BirA family biotin operon repressor/biotin-[acetyl-CoA-carboxylase] ligase
MSELGQELNAEGLQDQCKVLGLPWRVRVLAETASTNDVLREEGRKGEVVGQVVFAERQTAGRGRRHHVWESAAGQDLLFSLALRPAVEVAKWTRVTQLTALAVCLAVEAELGLQLAIKWPNDLQFRGKKVCGILVESFGGADDRYLIIGIGLNVNGTQFAPGLAETATSLRLASESDWVRERGVDREALASCLLVELNACLAAAENEAAFFERMQAVRVRNALLGKQVKLLHEGQEMWGQVTGLDDEGALLLRLPDGAEVTVASAEQVRTQELG